ncbi:MAG: hypothetical protein GX604_05170 [Actinobacteria bacterium]|nr:hypothetical protein [Actinomycetota bacterium]
MTRSYKLTESPVPVRRTESLYADIIADFVAQEAESVQVTIEGIKPATLRAGLRRALKGKEGEGVKPAQIGEMTYVVRVLAG